MERTPETLEERMARLEGQYHALSKELTDGLSGMQNSVDQLRQEVEKLTSVKSSMLKSESLPEVIQRMDQRLDEMHRQVIVIGNSLQTGK